MKHYLVELFKNPEIDEPAENAPAIHKHFTRYSRGEFDGPVVKIRRTKAKITVSCSYEYEDFALKLALNNLPIEELQVKGNIISGVDFTKLVDRLELDKVWYPKKNTGKTQNFITKIAAPVPIEKGKFLELIEKGEPYMYFLFNITDADNDVTLKCKAKPPRPSNKSPEKSSPQNKVKFCSLKIANTPENVEWIKEGAFIDFEDEIPDNWKSILIENSYTIEDLEFPKKKMSSRKFRLQTVRIGKINRILDVDGENLTQSFKFKA